MKIYRKHQLRNYFVQARPHLKDIIAIKFRDKNLGQGACITWGRIFTEQELIEIVAAQCFKQGFEKLEFIECCYSLQDISKYPYFYERWTYFIQHNISYKHDYQKWVQTKRKLVLHGQDIKFTGLNKCNAL